MCQLALDYLWGPHEVTKVSKAERRKKSQGGRGSSEGKPLGDDAMTGLKMEERGPEAKGFRRAAETAFAVPQNRAWSFQKAGSLTGSCF